MSDAMKSQSAMEYLMTYGWAILIIAVVLSVLFQLGVFSSGNFQPHAQAGSCQVSRTAAGVALEGQCDGMLPEFVGQFGPGGPSGGFANVPSSGMLNPSFFTLTFWISPTQLQSGNFNRILTKDVYASSPKSGWAVLWDGSAGVTGKIYMAGWNSIGTETDSGRIQLSQNTWGFVTFVYNGYVIAPYYNGAPEATSGVFILQQAPTAINIGGGDSDAPGKSYYYGQLANIQYYNTTLSQSEIQALYLEGIGGAPIRPQNLTGWWPLNGNANDYSGNGNNGQPNGVTFSSSWESGYTAP